MPAPSSRIRLVLLLLATATLAACGGGGTETVFVPTPPEPGPAALFSGSYHLVGVRGTEGGGSEEILVAWGSAQADGAGGLDTVAWANLNGAVGGPVGAVGGTYDVNDDWEFGTGEPLEGTHSSEGGLAARGDLAAVGSVWPGNEAGIFLYARAATGLDEGSLAGTWHYAAFGGTPGGVATSSSFGTVTFDGLGGGTSEIAVNQEGATFGPANVPIAYTVAPDGDMTLAFNGGSTYEGGVAVDGDLIVLGGAMGAGEGPSLQILLRQGSGLTDAAFDGAYFVVGMTQLVGSSTYISFTGHLEADGAGTADIIATANEEGAISIPPVEGLITSVAGNGALTVTTSGGETMTGGLSPNGRFVLIAGPTDPGTNPALFLLYR